MSGLLNDLSKMRVISDENIVRHADQPARRAPLYVALCAKQLKLAVEESRSEMDGLTLAAMGGRDAASIDVITRLQSIDRLMQRLSNVQANLERLVPFLESDSKADQNVTWNNLLVQARGAFTMEHERQLFDEILGETRGDPAHCNNNLTLFGEREDDA